MKTLLLTLMGLFTAGSMIAQKSVSIPFEISQDLATRFPQATSAKWEAAGHGFEAEWRENGKEVAAIYDAESHFVMVEREIDIAQLPEAVVKSVSKNFKGAKMQEAESQEHADKSMTYQVEMKQGKKSHEVTFGADGTRRQGEDGSGDGGNGSEGDDGSDGSDED